MHVEQNKITRVRGHRASHRTHPTSGSALVGIIPDILPDPDAWPAAEPSWTLLSRTSRAQQCSAEPIRNMALKGVRPMSRGSELRGVLKELIPCGQHSQYRVSTSVNAENCGTSRKVDRGQLKCDIRHEIEQSSIKPVSCLVFTTPLYCLC